jgi:hypothetical protein
MVIRFPFDESSDEGRYLIACARIRNCSMTSLGKRLLEAIAKDQMVLSILDDDSKPVRRKREHKFSVLRLP